MIRVGDIAKSRVQAPSAHWRTLRTIVRHSNIPRLLPPAFTARWLFTEPAQTSQCPCSMPFKNLAQPHHSHLLSATLDWNEQSPSSILPFRQATLVFDCSAVHVSLHGVESRLECSMLVLSGHTHIVCPSQCGKGRKRSRTRNQAFCILAFCLVYGCPRGLPTELPGPGANLVRWPMSHPLFRLLAPGLL
ncbi:hypothetical protein BOTBODRAFT_271022 [Botryobasidium botryosum FD-172 SS1]|uniref:Uncharacterized protein n=1 Tax=Botryobasidium botryosum (strain FD-172 SS1) TaxID=930990 RepID=A0A067LS56_BOTB1|nr:hypothetical protein BOTBODRAFT_271022 [Botryobasidium botryosum FD-172 SS1]